MDKKELKDYVEDVVSCALEDSKVIEDDSEARDKFVKEVTEKLYRQVEFYAWERINENSFLFRATKRKREQDRIDEKFRRSIQEDVAINLHENSSEFQLRLVKKRRMNEAIKETQDFTTPYTYQPAEKELPENFEKLPMSDENEREPWDYVSTYKTDASCLLSLMDAPLEEVINFLIRNCHSAEEMKTTMVKISQCGLVDKEISWPIENLLDDIVEMEKKEREETEKVIKDIVKEKLTEENIQQLIKATFKKTVEEVED
uniref:Uncharacterized protein n=1 Tax=Marseillevirus LCMAC101 TaxID=2506602 RepID=A0A481YRS9_9VIRU|nr:MAG: hypothetical protein LCMAC101_05070 [Marseillevirus LCMAC101]